MWNNKCWLYYIVTSWSWCQSQNWIEKQALIFAEFASLSWWLMMGCIRFFVKLLDCSFVAYIIGNFLWFSSRFAPNSEFLLVWLESREIRNNLSSSLNSSHLKIRSQSACWTLSIHLSDMYMGSDCCQKITTKLVPNFALPTGENMYAVSLSSESS